MKRVSPVDGLLLSLLGILAAGCAGGRGTLRVESDKYPVSMTEFLFAADGSVVRAKQSQVVGKLQDGWGQWTLLWTLIPLNRRDQDLSQLVNAAVEQAGGNAVVNFRMTCGEDPIWMISSLIPVIPTLARIHIDGDIVRL